MLSLVGEDETGGFHVSDTFTCLTTFDRGFIKDELEAEAKLCSFSAVSINNVGFCRTVDMPTVVPKLAVMRPSKTPLILLVII